jgi:hypothetical protein
VESDRFDDVEFRMIEEPSPPPRRPRRRGLVAAGAVLTACALGLGGSALADSNNPAASRPAAKPSFHDTSFRHHGGCHHGDRYRSHDSAPTSTGL